MKFSIRFPVRLSQAIKREHKLSTFIRFALIEFLQHPVMSIPVEYDGTKKTRISLPDELFSKLQAFSNSKGLPVSQVIFLAVEMKLKDNRGD